MVVMTVKASYAPEIEVKTPSVTPKIDSGCTESMTRRDIQLCIKETFKNDFTTALAVAEAESGLRQEAVNYNKIDGVVWSKDCGVFQVNDYYHDRACEMTAKENIEYAYKLYLKTGWTSWAAYNNGSYLKYLP